MMSETISTGHKRPFLFLHVGDQHLTVAGAQNHRDLQSIFAQIAGLPRSALDFVYLPGDIAEDGTGSQYVLIRQCLAGLDAPVFLIPGDHDRQYGSMSAFHDFYAATMSARHKPKQNRVAQYYFAETINEQHCLFLDMVSDGHGRKGAGLDFVLGDAQLSWLEAEVVQHAAAGKSCAVFMHTYPADLRSAEAARVAKLFNDNGVRLVEMGHTHYNELAHDGVTTYAAARSVGQNEDGSVGYAVCAIDEGEVSWRFRPLDRTWPFVLITSPVDCRLRTKSAPAGAEGSVTVRAVVLSDQPIEKCVCRVDEGPWRAMVHTGGQVFTASVECPPGARTITVRAQDPRYAEASQDYIDTDVIRLVPPDHSSPSSRRIGSDDFRVGVWPEKGLRGDQLGPNRVGREW